jgi:hypothetical protein
MAGVKITQLRSQMATGRRYGSFVGKPASGASTHPVGKLTQLHSQMATGKRYSSFAGKPASTATTFNGAWYRRRRR